MGGQQDPGLKCAGLQESESGCTGTQVVQCSQSCRVGEQLQRMLVEDDGGERRAKVEEERRRLPRATHEESWALLHGSCAHARKIEEGDTASVKLSCV